MGVSTTQLTRLLAGRFAPPGAQLPRHCPTRLRASESLSPGRTITALEEALYVLGACVLPLPEVALRSLCPPAAAGVDACWWIKLLPYFLEERWLMPTMRRFVEPERDRMTIPLGTLCGVLQSDGKAVLADKLLAVMRGVAASAHRASEWDEAQATFYDYSVLCTLPGREGAWRAFGITPNGTTEAVAAPVHGTGQQVEPVRRPSQDPHFDHEAALVARTAQLGERAGRWLMPPTSLLAPMGGNGRVLHVMPYKTLPGNATEARRNRCTPASFTDVLGNVREPVVTNLRIRPGSVAWFTCAHAGGAAAPGDPAALALFGRTRTSAFTAEPNVQNLFRCHLDPDADVDRPHQLAPRYGFPPHLPVAVPYFNADGGLPWKWDNGRGDEIIWRLVRAQPHRTAMPRPPPPARPGQAAMKRTVGRPHVAAPTEPRPPHRLPARVCSCAAGLGA